MIPIPKATQVELMRLSVKLEQAAKNRESLTRYIDQMAVQVHDAAQDRRQSPAELAHARTRLQEQRAERGRWAREAAEAQVEFDRVGAAAVAAAGVEGCVFYNGKFWGIEPITLVRSAVARGAFR